MPSSVKVNAFVRNGKYGQVAVTGHTRQYKGKYIVKGFTRTINQNLPKRQFIGRSEQLNQIIRKTILEEMRIAISK